MFQPKQIALALGAVFLSGSLFAADDMSELKAQMKALMEQNAALTAKLEDMQKQIKTLDSNVGAVPKTFKVVTAGDEDGTFKLPGSDTSVGIYGFVNITGTHDFTGRNSGDWSADLGSQPVKGANDTRGGKTYFSARTSRFGIKTVTPTELGTLRTKVEGDFNDVAGGGNGSAKLRLRHAYGEIDGDWGKLLGGQTWSTFMNLDAIPETVDFNGPANAAFMRQAMFRYTAKLGVAGELAVALENPNSQTDWGQSSSQSSPNINSRPDLVAKWTKEFSRGFISAQGLLGEYRVRDNNVDANKNTWGVGLGGALKLTDKDTLTLQLTSGRGLSRYMASVYYNDAQLSNGSILLYRSNSYLTGWARAWSETVRTNLSWGETYINDHFGTNSASLDGLENRRLSEGFANVFWTIAKNTDLGLEYNWGARRTYEDSTGLKYKGTRSRIEASLQYNF